MRNFDGGNGDMSGAARPNGGAWLRLALGGLSGVLATAAFALPAQASPTRDEGPGTTTVQSQPYYPPSDLFVNCASGSGGACFSLPAGTTKIWAAMADRATTGTAAEIVFQDASAATIGEPHSFCGSSGHLPVPAGAVSVMVTADGALFNTLDDHCGAAAIATTGTATLSSFVPARR
jgi:hypothetical protein